MDDLVKPYLISKPPRQTASCYVRIDEVAASGEKKGAYVVINDCPGFPSSMRQEVSFLGNPNGISFRNHAFPGKHSGPSGIEDHRLPLVASHEQQSGNILLMLIERLPLPTMTDPQAAVTQTRAEDAIATGHRFVACIEGTIG